jgi:hypothetical protein
MVEVRVVMEDREGMALRDGREDQVRHGHAAMEAPTSEEGHDGCCAVKIALLGVGQDQRLGQVAAGLLEVTKVAGAEEDLQVQDTASRNVASANERS